LRCVSQRKSDVSGIDRRSGKTQRKRLAGDIRMDQSLGLEMALAHQASMLLRVAKRSLECRGRIADSGRRMLVLSKDIGRFADSQGRSESLNQACPKVVVLRRRHFDIEPSYRERLVSTKQGLIADYVSMQQLIERDVCITTEDFASLTALFDEKAATD
jgi:hypothetical protein